MEESIGNFKAKWMLLIGVALLFSSCVVEEEEPIKTEIPVDTFWMYSSSCLMDFEENFLNRQSIRITDREGLEVLTSCSDEIPEVDFDDFFLFVSRFESMGFPIFRDQRLYSIQGTELVYEIEISISDFTGKGIIYCLGVIPNEFSQNEISLTIHKD